MKIHTIMKGILCVVLLAIISQSAVAVDSKLIRSEKQGFNLVTLVKRLSHPWSIAFLPDGRMLVTERTGRLRIISKDFKLDPISVEGVPRVVEVGQAGLFDVVLHPEYSDNGWIYLSYSGLGQGGHGTELMRAKLEGHKLIESQVLFRMEPKTPSDHHLGGRIVFDRKGYVYLTLGDRGEMERAQRLDDHAGSVIRLHDDGRVPEDNPFVKQIGAKPEKFTLGHRNMQGAALHPITGEIWTHEHGPQGGDEINIIRAGLNYGWPVITYGVNYVIGTKIGEGTHKQGMEQPIYKWVPSIAPSGMAFYNGDKFPAWKNNLFIGALRGEILVRLELDGEKVIKEERLLKGLIGRIRDVRVGPDGYIYLLTDESDGILARLEPMK